jgi:bifunctional UDP-N-acetylglucosamine pyrophosphorylase / glucosamine-1-phosphate N-acetyltransferase
MTQRPWLSIILAAGLGTRMKSALPKVLHAVAGRPMVTHAAAAVFEAGTSQLAVVVGPEMESVAGALETAGISGTFFVQNERRGTAHAVLSARAAIEAFEGDVLVVFGDTPLMQSATLRRLHSALDGGASIAVLAFEADNPHGYGRILSDVNGALIAIREERDASEEERAVRLCNSGVMAFRAGTMLGILDHIGNDNAKQEYYLSDAVAVARAQGLDVAIEICTEEDVLGVNDRKQLAAAEAIMQRRLRDAAMDGGATLIAPETVTFSHDTRIGKDVLIEPNVFFGPGVSIGDNAHIKAFSHFEQAIIGNGAEVGPFARLRPGANLGERVRIGNFVELKKATVEAGAKINHLSYIGDAHVGAKANIGAGTIVCNYDGFSKHFTDIGAGAFIGSNSALVAPVKIGDGAYVGSGSVITEDVEPHSLALERSQQRKVPGWAERFREKNKK